MILCWDLENLPGLVKGARAFYIQKSDEPDLVQIFFYVVQLVQQGTEADTFIKFYQPGDGDFQP
jgi:hypothetical protein